MEAVFTTYTATYGLARTAIVCAFGYLTYRVLASRRRAAVSNADSTGYANRAYTVPEDRC